jgi:ankyrin repeat protein
VAEDASTNVTAEGSSRDDTSTELTGLNFDSIDLDQDTHTFPVDNELHAMLRQSAAAGSLELVRMLVEELSADVNGGWTRDHLCTTPLHAAVANGHLAIVEYLISQKAYLYVCTAELVNPVHLASIRTDPSILNLLLAHDVKVLIQDARKQSPLHFAARAGSVECCKILLKVPKQKVSSLVAHFFIHFYQVDGLDHWTRTPMAWAVLNGHVDVVRVLLESGAHVDGTKAPFTFHMRSSTLLFEQPLHLACRLPLHKALAMVALLFSFGANPNIRSQSDQTALHMACQRTAQKDEVDDSEEYRHMCTTLVRLLLRAGAVVNVRDLAGRSPLMFCMNSHRYDLAMLLLSL